jgi:hypothetical protein
MLFRVRRERSNGTAGRCGAARSAGSSTAGSRSIPALAILVAGMVVAGVCGTQLAPRGLSQESTGAALRAESAAPANRPERVEYNRDVRPILSQNCFFCHGPDEKHREAELRLDLRDAAITGLQGHAAIVPGKPDESMLLRRIGSTDADERMPPPQSKKPRLTDADAAILERWIAEGAEYEGHWAFLPLAPAAPPQVQTPAWPRNPIDRFILARLEREGLNPSPEADRATLIRRASLDLLGLLPSPDEVRQFVESDEPRAYEQLVDRLLASPHYGERWGRHWLDQARYADSNGYTIDAERDVWPYRDWVIQALNQDMPFDRFTIEQLAGDLLANPTKSQLVATGFHRNTLINQEGGIDPEQYRVESVLDRVSTTGTVWLGLTVGCAQCHSHKFDPVSQREFYELMAFFNSTQDANDRGPTVSVLRGEMFGAPVSTPAAPPAPDPARVAVLRAAWEREQAQRYDAPAADATAAVVWTPAQYVRSTTRSEASLTLLDDNSLLVDNRAAPNDSYTVMAITSLPQVAALRVRALADKSLPDQGPGRAAGGRFMLTDFEFEVDGEAQGFSRARADSQRPGAPVLAAIDLDVKSGWSAEDRASLPAGAKVDHEGLFVLARPVPTAGRTLQIRLFHDGEPNQLIGRFAIDLAASAPALPANEAEQAEIAALQTPVGKRSPADNARLEAAFERAEPQARATSKRAEVVAAQQMILRERTPPRETFLLTRGNFTRPDVSVGPLRASVLSAVAPSSASAGPSSGAAPADRLPPADNATPAATTPSRLDLARWLVDARNPLTPRVTVNRIWMRYFGRGIVESDDDFGSQGSAPTHAALLDWLAGEFIRSGWSTKHIHRLIVTSATYRQSSRQRSDLLERDPGNLLLGQQNRLRLEGEIVRDAALCASGLLDRTIGGPSAHPPQPAGIYSFTQISKQWKTDTGPDRYRRGLYTFFYRSSPYPLFTTFDAPDFQTTCTHRPRSNTPLQSLTLANDPAFVELAQALAWRLATELPGDFEPQLAARIERGFLLTVCRQPTAEERSVLGDYALRQRAAFAADARAAAPLVTPQLAAAAQLSDAAALVCASRALLNTDNFISRE